MSEKKVFPKPVLIISFILILFGCVCSCIQLYHEFFVECNALRLIMSLLCFVGFVMTILYQLNILKDSRFFYTSLIFIFALTVAISGIVFSEFADVRSSKLDSVVLGVVRRLIQFLSLVVFAAVFVFDARCKDLKSRFFEESTEHLSRILFLEIAIMLIYLCCGMIPAGFSSIWGVFVSPLLFVGVFICYATRIAMKKEEKKEIQ
ncbi:MAG: hypothetical protein MJZ91_01100 [Bacteroidales bacterium]|nr:hypothetical protein [Bacteroidales bacterium]